MAKVHVVLTRTKLCHARAGDVVMVPGWTDTPFMVVAVMDTGRPARRDQPEGLFADQRTLYLCNLQTGELARPPHLSTQVTILHNPSIVISED